MPIKARNPFVRFREKVAEKPNGCWEWTGKRHRSGYGVFAIKHATNAFAHRWLYQRLHGAIQSGLELDHLCRNRCCVNPLHLELVTRRENLLRGKTIPAAHAAKTHCPQGHEYTAANTYLYRRMRMCVACRKARDAARRR